MKDQKPTPPLDPDSFDKLSYILFRYLSDGVYLNLNNDGTLLVTPRNNLSNII